MKTPTKISVAGTGLALGMLTLTACSGAAVSTDAESSTSAAAAVDEIVIGSLHPVSGSYAADGQQMANAAQMAVDAINEAGGIESLGGAQLVLEEGDTRGEAETAQSEATRLIQEGAVALVGSYQSSASANIAAVAERSGVPFVMDVSALDSILQQGYTYAFRLQPSASMMGAQAADALAAMADDAGVELTQVAYMYEQGNYGESAYTAFAAEAEALGFTVDPAISYDASSSDFSTQIQQVAASGADVLAVSGYYNDGVAIANAIDSIGPDLDAVFGVADGAFDQAQFIVDAPNGGEGFFNANYHWDVTDADAVALTDAYEAEFGETMRTSAVLTYDAVMLIAEAIEEAGSADPAAIRDAIATSSYEPMVVNDGGVSFDETGQNTTASVVAMQIQSGEVKQVFPVDLAEASYFYPAS